MTQRTLRDYLDKMYYCMRCGFCRPVCPTLSLKNMDERYSPRGRVLLMRGLVTGELAPSKSMADKIYLCATCRNCYVKCPPGLEIDKIVEAARFELVKAGVAPPEPHLKIAAEIKAKDNPLGEPKDKRVSWLSASETLPEKADVLYWAGCMASYRSQETARATVKILSKAGVDFTMLGQDEGCCGSVLIRTGQRELIENGYAKANVEKIAAKGTKTLVTACAGCYRTFKEDYRATLGALPFEVLHVSEYLERLIKDGRIVFDKEMPMKVTYHDPCHLGRHMNVYESPRNVVKSIPGVTLVEMARNRLDSRCCGAGGGLRSAYRDLSIKASAERLRLDALPTGAEALVSPCPFCVINFKDGAKALGTKIEVLDLVELVSRAL
jgi:Fe-S oxidoreductase